MSIAASATGQTAVSGQANESTSGGNKPPPRRTTTAKADLASQPEPR